MGQVSAKLRRDEGRYLHWCPACLEMHPLPDSWQFNGNLERPSFQPSFKHTGILEETGPDGEWTGEWKRGANGNTIPYLCHYVLTDGHLNFCNDCTHSFKNQKVPLPDLPGGLTD